MLVWITLATLDATHVWARPQCTPVPPTTADPICGDPYTQAGYCACKQRLANKDRDPPAYESKRWKGKIYKPPFPKDCEDLSRLRQQRLRDQGPLDHLSWSYEPSRKDTLCQGQTGDLNRSIRNYLNPVEQTQCDRAIDSTEQIFSLYKDADCDVRKITAEIIRNQADFGSATVLIARTFARAVGRKREEDMAVIEAFWRDNVGGPFEVDRKGLRQAADRLRTHVAGAASQMAETARPQDKDWMETLQGFFTNAYFGAGIGALARDQSRFRYRIEEILAKMPEKELGAFLQKEAVERDLGTTEKLEYEKLTPFEARMVFFYHTINRYLEKAKKDRIPTPEVNRKLNQMIEKLQLKFTTYHSPNWKQVIPHDGYVLGASRRNAETLFDLPSSSETTPGSGSDCSLFIEKVLNQLGTFMPKGRDVRTTTNTVAGGRLEEMDRFRVCSEAELEPGDIVVTGSSLNNSIGHTFVYAGYAESKTLSDPQPRVVEAVGMSNRTVRIAVWPTIRGKESNGANCQNTEFTQTMYFARRAKCTGYLAK